jgi:hypothetical protein
MAEQHFRTGMPLFDRTGTIEQTQRSIRHLFEQ